MATPNITRVRVEATEPLDFPTRPAARLGREQKELEATYARIAALAPETVEGETVQDDTEDIGF